MNHKLKLIGFWLSILSSAALGPAPPGVVAPAGDSNVGVKKDFNHPEVQESGLSNSETPIAADSWDPTRFAKATTTSRLRATRIFRVLHLERPLACRRVLAVSKTVLKHPMAFQLK
jgi:hypothetical protein